MWLGANHKKIFDHENLFRGEEWLILAGDQNLK